MLCVHSLPPPLLISPSLSFTHHYIFVREAFLHLRKWCNISDAAIVWFILALTSICWCFMFMPSGYYEEWLLYLSVDYPMICQLFFHRAQGVFSQSVSEPNSPKPKDVLNKNMEILNLRCWNQLLFYFSCWDLGTIIPLQCLYIKWKLFRLA